MSNKCVCTDPDCAQYCKQIDDYAYSYIEVRDFSEISKGAVVCSAEIDLRDYTLDDLWNYCSGYYDSYEQMVTLYGFRKALQIMAECVFEQLDLEEMSFISKQKNIDSAIKLVHEFIEM